MGRRNSKTFYPPKSFDDELAGLVKLAADNTWVFSNIDFKRMAQDVIDQRSERSEHDLEEVKFNHKHETFGLNQEARHGRFSSALDAARGAFKNDKAVMAQLAKFKRSVRRNKKVAALEAVPAEALAVKKAA